MIYRNYTESKIGVNLFASRISMLSDRANEFATTSQCYLPELFKAKQ